MQLLLLCNGFYIYSHTFYKSRAVTNILKYALNNFNIFNVTSVLLNLSQTDDHAI